MESLNRANISRAKTGVWETGAFPEQPVGSRDLRTGKSSIAFLSRAYLRGKKECSHRVNTKEKKKANCIQKQGKKLKLIWKAKL